MDTAKGSPLDSRQETIRNEAGDGAGSHAAMASRSDRELLPERLIEGRYQLLKQIGSGGMGVVYLAVDSKLERHVAIKRLVVRSYNARTVQRRFLREAQTIAALGHYNIVNIFDVGQDEDGHYIVMEYVPGPSLSDKVKPVNPPMPVNLHQYVTALGKMESAAATALIRKVCSALDYAHNQGIIHRDIKPTNILLNPSMEPKLVDFGLARPINLAKSEEITLAGSILGTPEYCAPEQWGDASAVDVRTDVYAMAGVFWYALSGRSPRYFREHDLEDDLAAVIGKALSAKPEDRPSTIQAFIADLDRVRSPDGQASVAISPPSEETIAQGFWSCRNCGASNPDTAKYCVNCGASGLDSCPNCGTLYRAGASHCPGCGVDLRLVEEAATMLTTAKNHASFCEYETALDYLNEGVRASSPEARALYKECREIVLRRRNQLMELDSALRIYNMEKAIELAVALQKSVPEECLSESADFKVTSHFSSMLQELKQMLIEAANRAKQDFNLARFSETIGYLNQVFGDEACHVVNLELRRIQQELDGALTQAGLAAGMNCFSHAQEVLDSTDPWKGDELGNRRARLFATCKEHVELRERAIEDTEQAIQEGRFSDALSLVKEMATFRLPPNNSEITPAPGDRAAQDRIIRIDKALTSTIEQSVGDWVKNNEWANVVNSVAALKGSDSSAWKRLSEKLRNAANQEIVRRYNHAIEEEKRGRYHRAGKAWQEFQAIPIQLMPTHLLQYAHEFPSRAQVHGLRQANTVWRRVVPALATIWLLFLGMEAWGVVRDITELPPIKQGLALAPVTLGLIAWIAVLGIARLGRFKRYETREIAEGRSPRLILLTALTVLSPLAYLIHMVFHGVFSFSGSGTPAAYPLLAVAVIWIVLDIVRRGGLELPGKLAATIGWLIAAPTLFALQRLTTENYIVWPLLALIHGLLFALVLIIHRAIQRRRAKGAKEPAAPPAG